MIRSLLMLFLIGSVVAGVSACMPAGLKRPLSLHEIDGGLKVGDIVDAHTGDVLSFPVLMAKLARARLIYVGESHTSKEDHRVQLKVLKGLHAQNRSLTLAMEMFPREVQPLLDRYASGEIPEEEFLKEVDWDRTWGYPFQLYRGIMTWARDQRIRIVGLNAPHEVVRKIAQSGLSSLTVTERNRVAREFHPDDPVHQEYLRRQYHLHQKESISDLNTFMEAQLAWEETMAETLVETLAAGAPDEQVVVLIGKGHISDRVGVPRLVRERLEQPGLSIAPVPLDYPGRTADPSIADYVWITDRPESLHRIRLGVVFRHAGSPTGGLEVLGVLPDSPAEKAGIKKGDILYRVDGTPVTSLEEVHRAISGRPVHELMLKRGGRSFSVNVTLSP